MRAVMKIAIAAAVVAVTLSVSYAQAPNAMVREYGYQFCAIMGAPPDSYRDCMYSTWQQCWAAASPNAGCFENPAYIAARANGAAPQTRTRR